VVVLFLPVEYFFSSFCYSSFFSNPVVQNGGKIGSQGVVNLPGKKMDLPALTEQDTHYLKLGVEQGVDMVFASFIQDKDYGLCIMVSWICNYNAMVDGEYIIILIHQPIDA